LSVHAVDSGAPDSPCEATPRGTDRQAQTRLRRRVPSATIDPVPRTIGSLRVLSGNPARLPRRGLRLPGPLTVPERSKPRAHVDVERRRIVRGRLRRARSTTLRRLELGKTVEGRSLVGVLRAVRPVASSSPRLSRTPRARRSSSWRTFTRERWRGKEAVLEMLRREAFEGGLSAADGCVVLFSPELQRADGKRPHVAPRASRPGGSRSPRRSVDAATRGTAIRTGITCASGEPETRALLGAGRRDGRRRGDGTCTRRTVRSTASI
jgi:hypothetical protein